MKMKKILKMPLRRMQRRPAPAEALRAKATASSGTYEKEDYEIEQEEPNMKFSHALLVVLALHVIAVGGVFAFNSIKAGQAAAAKSAAKEEIARAAARVRPAKALGARQRHRGLARANTQCKPATQQPARFALQDHHRSD
jgi:hypothetical protein